MSRPERITALVDTALVWAQRSTCSRLSVGAVFHRNGRILVQGYNGAPPGIPHCNHDCTCPPGYPYIRDEAWVHKFGCPSTEPCTASVHAEQNAINWAASVGVRLGGSSCVVTDQPCLKCAQSLIGVEVKEVTYIRPYRLSDGVDLLDQAGIKVNEYIGPSSFSAIGFDE